MKPFVIGIAGGSAGGKSTFANNLKNALCDKSVLVMGMDTYFLPPEDRRVVTSPIKEADYRDDNHPTSFDLERLKADLHFQLSEVKYEVIIIEGLLTLWEKEIYGKLDLKLFVDCRPDERIVRRLKRNMGWGLSFDEISAVYLDMVRFRHDEFVEPTKWKADLILNGSNLTETALEVIKAYINAKQKS